MADPNTVVSAAYNQVSKQGNAYLRLTAGRACQRCRQQRIRCDLGKPCKNCVKAGDDCQHVDIAVACYCCSRSKVKCDKQRPCGRCVKRGKPDDCFGPEVEEAEQPAGSMLPSRGAAFAGPPNSQPLTVQQSPQQHPQQCAQLPAHAHLLLQNAPPQLPPLQERHAEPQSQQPTQPQTQQLHTSGVFNNGAALTEPDGTAHGQEMEVRREDLLFLPTNAAMGASISQVESIWSDASTPLADESDDEEYSADFVTGKRCRWDFESAKEECQSYLVCPRPLKTHRALQFHDNAAQRAAMRLKLRYMALQQIWDAGYSADCVLRLFNSLPRDLRAVVEQGLLAMETLFAFQRAQGQSKPRHPRPAPPAQPEMSLEEGLDRRDGAGQWIVCFDPDTGRRTSCQLNDALCHTITRMHPEEMLTRAGASDLLLPHSELEFLCNVLDEMLHARDPTMTRYSRMVIWRDGRLKETAMVRRKVTRAYSAGGVPVKNVNVVTRVSQEEYDLALHMDPTVCRPFTHALGDRRTGEDLAADAPRDVLFEEKFSEMVSTVAGIAKLAKLTDVLRANFEPYVRMAACLPGAPEELKRQEQPPGLELSCGLSDCFQDSGFCSRSPSPLLNHPLSFDFCQAAQAIPWSRAMGTDPLI